MSCLGINRASRGPLTLKPVSKFQGHLNGVSDVRWNPSREQEFASVDEDAMLALWDVRTTSRPAQKVKAADCEIFCVDFSRADEHQLVTGASDSSVRLWDSRSLKHAVHTFCFHSNDVLQIQVRSRLRMKPLLCTTKLRVYVSQVSLHMISTYDP